MATVSRPTTPTGSDDEISDTDSFATMADMLNQLNLCVSEMYGIAEELEEELHELHPPLQDLTIAQFGEAAFLASSPFRHATFAFRNSAPALPGLDLSRRYPFHEICKKLREALVALGAIRPDGIVVMTPALQTLFETSATELHYVELLGLLHAVLE
jgi:hypothetical protein